MKQLNLEQIHTDLDEIWIQKTLDDADPKLEASDVFQRVMESLEHCYKKWAWQIPDDFLEEEAQPHGGAGDEPHD